MLLKNKELHINFDRMFYFFIGIYMLMLFIGNTTYYLSVPIIGLIVKYTRYICYSIFLYKIFRDWKHGNNITITIIVSALLSILIAVFSKNKDIMFLFLFLIAIRNVNFNKIINMVFRIYIILFLIIVNGSLLNIIPDWTYSRYSTIRHSLGFYYPTITIGIFLSIILMYFYIKKSKVSITELIVLETINVFLYTYTDGRLSFILSSIVLLSMYLSKFNIIKNIFKSKFIQKSLKYICYVLPFTLFIATVIMVYLYSINNSFAISINNLLSGRLQYTQNAIKQYGFSLFGQPIKWNGWGGYGYINIQDMATFKYNYVDISYMRIMFDYGIIFSIIALIEYTIILIKNYEKKDYWMLGAIFFVLIWSLVEPYILNVGKNIFVISLVSVLNLGEIKKWNYSNISSKFKRGIKNEEIHN